MTATATGAERYTDRPLPEVEGVTHGYRRVGEVDMHYAEAGSGPPLVLVHGFPQHWYVWRRAIPVLARHHRVICPDLRGFGWSQAPPDGYDKETLARDVLGLLDELEVERFSIAGHDWGAWVGFLLAIRHPERVRRLMVLSMSHPFWRLERRWLAHAWRMWHGATLSTPVVGARALQPGSRVGERIWRWLGAEAWTPEERDVFLSQFREPERARAVALLYRAVRAKDVPRMLNGSYRRRGLKVPTVMLHGVRDGAIPPVDLTGYEEFAADLRIESLDCGHAVLEEQADTVLERMVSFFAPEAEAEPAREPGVSR